MPKKKKSLQRYRALSDDYIWEKKCSCPKMTGQNDWQDESLTGQVCDQAGHCPLTGRYFLPRTPTVTVLK